MDELEPRVRNVLADDHLTLMPRRDALALIREGVRRRRRNRVIAAAAAVVVCIGGGAVAATQLPGQHAAAPIPPVGGDRKTPTPTPTPTPPTSPPTTATTDTVPWLPDPYDYRYPPAFPGTVADASVPWCRADQLNLSASWQGAGGSWVGPVVVTNTSPTACAVQGQPAVRMVTADGHTLTASHPEPFYVDAWVRLASGHSASAVVEWQPEFCHEPAAASVDVALPHSGGSLSTPMRGAPRCDNGALPASAGRLIVQGFTDGNVDAPFTPLAGLQATVDRAAPTVLAGGVLDYRLALQNTSGTAVALDPCLPFRQRLVDPVTQHVVAENDYRLNCDAAPRTIGGADNNGTTYFDLRLTLPPTIRTGHYLLVWQSVLQPVHAAGGSDVKVDAAPTPCRDGQLTASAGRTGAAAGSYYTVILLRNVSGSTCALYGYPGVQLADAGGRGVTTKTHRDPTSMPHLVVVGPNAVVSATISGANAGADGGATPCPPSAGVLVIPPGLRGQLLVRGVGTRCFDTVFVWPVTEGTRGSLGG